MKIYTLLSFVLLLGYLAATYFVIYKKKDNKVPTSLSDTHYAWRDLNIKWSFIFPVAMLLVAGFLMPAWISIAYEINPNLQFLAFLSTTGLAFVAAAPCFKKEQDSKVHSVAAAIAGLSAIAWIIFAAHCWWVILVFAAVFGGLAYWSKSWKASWLFWAEMAVFFATYLSIFIA